MQTVRMHFPSVVTCQLLQAEQRKPKHFLSKTTSGFCFDRKTHARTIFQLSKLECLPVDDGKECNYENWVIKQEKIEWKLSVPRWHSKRLNLRKYFSMQNVEVKHFLSLVFWKFRQLTEKLGAENSYHNSDQSFPRQVLLRVIFGRWHLEWINVPPSHWLLSLDSKEKL